MQKYNYFPKYTNLWRAYLHICKKCCTFAPNMQFIGIIPARYASTRFPGKPLADLCGKPVIQHVYEQACQVLDTVIVATDDQRIYDCVQGFGGLVYMTSSEHRCGTDRISEAYQLFRASSPNNSIASLSDHEVVVVNIQGDEPFIQPEQIRAVMRCFPTDIATLAKPYTERDNLQELLTPNVVKVVFSSITHEAMYFSRSVIPYLRGVDEQDWIARRQH